jgi:prepilin-type N-terminal cleavage/methylation domain-containing protein
MRRSPPGFTLVEVVVALLLLAIGLLATGAGLIVAQREAGRGTARARAALALASRLDLLREEAERTMPPCAGLAPGAAIGPHGLSESWSVRPESLSVLITIRVAAGAAGPPVVDSAVVRFPCQ